MTMDRSSASRLRLKVLLNVFLLVSMDIACLHGYPTTGNHSLHCVNDYLFTVNCTLRIASQDSSDGNCSYWLTFTQAYGQRTFACMLTNANGYYFCSVKTSDWMPDDYEYSFTDTDSFEISLCHNQTDGTEVCEGLDDEYAPSINIKPNAPCCLAVSHSSSQHHFTWNSTYEEYGDFTNLVDSLKYQLHYVIRGKDDNRVMPRDINTDSTKYSVEDEVFVPDTEYAARVRSSPNMAHYQGEWSDWSPEVHWRTESAKHDPATTTFVLDLGKVVIPLCVMVPLILLLCYAPVKKWKQSAFIPTPAPYFHTLYSDFQGDFKSWVVTQENAADMLKAEATLQIDTLTKCADVQEEDRQPAFHHPLIEGSTYSNIIDPVCDSFLLGVPYAVSTMAPLSAPEGSLKSLTLSSEPGSPAEGDSGCWLCSDSSLEKDSPWYCNEYCTLSAFQQTALGTAQRHGSLSTEGLISIDAIREA